MRTLEEPLKPKLCIAWLTAAPCGSKTLDFGVTNTVTFTFFSFLLLVKLSLKVMYKSGIPGEEKKKPPEPAFLFKTKAKTTCQDTC